MTHLGWFRIIVIAAGLMGAAGVILGAVAAHTTGSGALVVSASSMLSMHAPAAMLAVLLVDRQIIRPRIGLAAAGGFVAGAILFGADMLVRQFLGHHLFPMAAPSGGTLMIVSWFLLVAAAIRPRAASRSDQSGS